MNVLVTGGAGFIGSHTVVELIQKGYQVFVIDNLVNSKKGVFKAIKKITGVEPTFYEGSVCDSLLMDNIFSVNKIDFVIHFAGLKSNADSIINPNLYYGNNLETTRILLNTMLKHRVFNLIFSSSATVYGMSDKSPINESELVGDVISPYGMSKYLNELLLEDFSKKHKGFKIICLRYFNPIGAHESGLIGEDPIDDKPNCLMPYITRVALGKLDYLNVFGNDYPTSDGTGVRDYIHVTDLALGHIACLDYMTKNAFSFDIFNLGTGKGSTVLELIHSFEAMNSIHIPFRIVGRRPGDVAISFACVDKANRVLGWHTKLTIDDCVRTSWRFQLLNPTGYDKYGC